MTVFKKNLKIMCFLKISIFCFWIMASFSSSLLKNWSRRCILVSFSVKKLSISLFLFVMDKLDRQKEALSPKRYNAKGLKRRLCVHCPAITPAYGCTSKKKNVKRREVDVAWREERSATHELRRTREKEKKKRKKEEMKEREEKSGSFLWCMHVALDSGWSEARADRFGLRSQLPRTLT